MPVAGASLPRSALSASAVAVVVVVLSLTAFTAAADMNPPPVTVVQFFMDIADGSCATKWPTSLAAGFVWTSFSGVEPPPAVDASNKSETIGDCAALNPNGVPSVAMQPINEIKPHVIGPWSFANIFVSMALGPPVTPNGTANCTVGMPTEESMIVDDEGKWLTLYDETDYGDVLYHRVRFCMMGEPLPKIDNSASSDPIAFVTRVQEAMWSGDCDGWGASLASNFTSVENGRSAQNKADAIATCKAMAGHVSYSTTPVSSFVSDGSVVASHKAAMFVRDVKTGKQCGVFYDESLVTHTYVDPVTNTRVIDSVVSFMDMAAIARLQSQCHYKGVVLSFRL